MSFSAKVMIILTQGLVTLATAYFFWKVLKTPPKSEPDSYSDNDNVER